PKSVQRRSLCGCVTEQDLYYPRLINLGLSSERHGLHVSLYYQSVYCVLVYYPSLYAQYISVHERIRYIEPCPALVYVQEIPREYNSVGDKGIRLYRRPERHVSERAEHLCHGRAYQLALLDDYLVLCDHNLALLYLHIYACLLKFCHGSAWLQRRLAAAYRYVSGRYLPRFCSKLYCVGLERPEELERVRVAHHYRGGSAHFRDELLGVLAAVEYLDKQALPAEYHLHVTLHHVPRLLQQPVRYATKINYSYYLVLRELPAPLLYEFYLLVLV